MTSERVRFKRSLKKRLRAAEQERNRIIAEIYEIERAMVTTWKLLDIEEARAAGVLDAAEQIEFAF